MNRKVWVFVVEVDVAVGMSILHFYISSELSNNKPTIWSRGNRKS